MYKDASCDREKYPVIQGGPIPWPKGEEKGTLMIFQLPSGLDPKATSWVHYAALSPDGQLCEEYVTDEKYAARYGPFYSTPYHE